MIFLCGGHPVLLQKNLATSSGGIWEVLRRVPDGERGRLCLRLARKGKFLEGEKRSKGNENRRHSSSLRGGFPPIVQRGEKRVLRTRTTRKRERKRKDGGKGVLAVFSQRSHSLIDKGVQPDCKEKNGRAEKRGKGGA